MLKKQTLCLTEKCHPKILDDDQPNIEICPSQIPRFTNLASLD